MELQYNLIKNLKEIKQEILEQHLIQEEFYDYFGLEIIFEISSMLYWKKISDSHLLLHVINF